jgi:hypothetical protein
MQVMEKNILIKIHQNGFNKEMSLIPAGAFEVVFLFT